VQIIRTLGARKESPARPGNSRQCGCCQSRSEHDHPQPVSIRRSGDLTDEATQEAEDQMGLDKGKRRDVQRRLTGLGFDTKVNFFVLIPCKSPSGELGAGEAQLAGLRSGAVVEA
jgi:hypothetical protein